MSISSVTLPTALVTGLAVLQSVLLTTLLVPWPLRVRKPLIRLILESPVAAKVIYGTKIGVRSFASLSSSAWTGKLMPLPTVHLYSGHAHRCSRLTVEHVFCAAYASRG